MSGVSIFLARRRFKFCRGPYPLNFVAVSKKITIKGSDAPRVFPFMEFPEILLIVNFSLDFLIAVHYVSHLLKCTAAVDTSAESSEEDQSTVEPTVAADINDSTRRVVYRN